VTLLSPISILSYIAVWLAVVIIYFLLTGTWKVSRFRFSIFNYYVMMSAFVLAVIARVYLEDSWQPLIYFLIFAVAGVIGETIVSIWWRLFFTKRFWVYNVETIDHAYTSWLNFVPWAVGGSLYLNVLQRTTTDPFGDAYANLWLIATILCVTFFLMQFGVFKVTRRQPYRSAHILSLVLFFWPIGALIGALAWIYGPQIYMVAAAFGVIATLAEYLYGKSTEFFISKKLWTYSYGAIDRGHFTPLSIPLFILGGFYFWGIALVLHAI
jgi:hypothetical protein